MAKIQNRYRKLIESIFLRRFKEGVQEIIFKREELVSTAMELGIKLPKNLGDVVYSSCVRLNFPC